MSVPSGRYPIASDGPPPAKKIVSSQIVKVSLSPRGTAPGAIVVSKDKKIATTVPRSSVSKRFPSGQLVGYFRSELDEEGILEIGDRVPNEDW